MKNIQYGTEFLDQLKDRVHDLYDENVKLEEEIKRLKEEYMMLQNASDEVEEEKDKEIERLQDLCNKYEEEHKTTFEEWKKAINIIKEVREYINKIPTQPVIRVFKKELLEIINKVEGKK